ncbi:MAG: hypothetical protein D6812_17525 [Deltaproteobacteria bacterium]|nr:MAG: hypothetical protein D6812_17525 [Deltaproteobacteria bacterium]
MKRPPKKRRRKLRRRRADEEKEGDVFETVRKRIRTANRRIRSMKSDYLLYALMDAVIDHYFLAVEHIWDRIEEIEDPLMADPNPDIVPTVHQLKRNILILRKAIWPLQAEIGRVQNSESPLIHPETRIFLRDLYDHIIQIMDMMEMSWDSKKCCIPENFLAEWSLEGRRERLLEEGMPFL